MGKHDGARPEVSRRAEHPTLDRADEDALCRGVPLVRSSWPAVAARDTWLWALWSRVSPNGTWSARVVAQCANGIGIRGIVMPSVARVTEISAISEQSFEDAVRMGIERAATTLRNLQSAWIKEQEVQLADDGTVRGYKVNMQVTFVLE